MLPVVEDSFECPDWEFERLPKKRRRVPPEEAAVEEPDDELP